MNLYSQDSIVNYLDNKGNTIKDKSKARFIETIVKKDSLFLKTKYFRDGKISKKGYHLNDEKYTPVGQVFDYHFNGSIQKITEYNDESKKHGVEKFWFYNGNLDHISFYDNDKKVGVWKYFHINGKKACRRYFNEGEVIKTLFYDINGVKTASGFTEFTTPKFKNGSKKNIYKELKNLTRKINFKTNLKIKGTIYINFLVDTNGKVSSVVINDNIPNRIKNIIYKFFKESKEWTSAKYMNRNVPYSYNLPLTFY
ncbi:antitoxin component YwqK of YwqJK toxin-antitoxin module [Lutibacter sp. Hel_I_33_5]|uniref:toxin-antitoxin system YwqK family antitoxin n=1 Tax=Lutibacter sp. Hel_I_33_5 TaxID=1566289 RepID=UPI0011A543C8|nr:hypothetical protein [Lutibacter sp. Hel_I_33_5]TVZ55129.1 antitoxin component YwqK of YwqJK toxin-antitoxin module [Lutibacter sp. Hel_I_33_5]